MTIFIVMLCLSALALACSIFFFLAARPCFINKFFSLKKMSKKKKELLFLRIHFCVIYYWLSSIRH